MKNWLMEHLLLFLPCILICKASCQMLLRHINGQVVMSIVAAALLILVGVAAIGEMYFYAVSNVTEKAPTAAITNLSSRQVVAGHIEIRGSARGEIQTIFVQVDGGSAGVETANV